MACERSPAASRPSPFPRGIVTLPRYRGEPPKAAGDRQRRLLSAFMLFDGYSTDGFYDEMFAADGSPRSCARLLYERITSVGDAELRRCQNAAEQALFRMGITFNVYGDQAGTEKIFPFDILPRIVAADE